MVCYSKLKRNYWKWLNFTTPTLSVGTYTYYAEANACSVNAMRTPITVTVSTCAGIHQIVNTEKLKIFPNPNNGEFEINLNAVSKTTRVEIYNSLGSLVLKIMPDNLNTSVKFNGIAGLYQLRIFENETVIWCGKMIKE